MQDDWYSPLNTWRRKEKLCLAYDVTFDPVSPAYNIMMFSVQNGRSDAYLGTIKMRQNEWLKFHETVYQKWENLSHTADTEESC